MSSKRHKILKWAKKHKSSNRAAPQVGAICTRVRKGKRQVLLVTSRETGRWVIPKGWPMKGLSDADAAAVEAWEEAGVTEAKHNSKPLGQFEYKKKLDDGTAIPVNVSVFRLKVKDTSKKYPEAKQRKRLWVSPAKAAKMVREPKLKRLFLQLKKSG